MYERAEIPSDGRTWCECRINSSNGAVDSTGHRTELSASGSDEECFNVDTRRNQHWTNDVPELNSTKHRESDERRVRNEAKQRACAMSDKDI